MNARRIFRIVPLFCLAGTLFLTGCLSMRRPLAIKDDPLKTAQTETLKASLRFLDDAQLSKNQKEVDLSRLPSLHMRRFMTFGRHREPRAGEGRFILNRLNSNTPSAEAMQRFQLLQEWEFGTTQSGVGRR
jgi:hypothetical protein